MNKRKRLFIKICSLVSAVALAFTCVMVKPKAYTYNSVDNTLYSNNALPFVHPEKIVPSNDDGVIFFNSPNYDEAYYIFTYSENYYYSAFIISLYSGESDDSFVAQLFGNTDLNSFYTAIPVSLFNGKSLNYCKANYSNYRIRFLVRSVGQGLPYQYGYLQFNCGALFDYWLQFMDGDTIRTNYVLTEAFSARYSTQDLTHFYLFSQCGIYCGNQSGISQSNLDYYGLDGEYKNRWNQDEYYNYQQSNLQLQQENTSLNNQINSLRRQLADANANKMQSLIWTIGSTPFESFKNIWDVNIMGLNIGGIVIGGIMALLVLYLIKKIWK